MSRALYVDEVKTPQYLMAALAVPSCSAQVCREGVRRLRVRGTSRVHFHSEQDKVRKAFIDAVRELATAYDLAIRLYVADHGSELSKRAAILGKIVADCSRDGISRLVLEMDASTRSHDEVTIRTARGGTPEPASLRYEIVDPVSEPLLWIPDAVAWAWRRDRHWRARVQPLVHDVVRIPVRK